MFEGSAQKQSMDALTVTTKKSCVVDSNLFQSLYSSAVAETVTALCLSTFTKKRISGLKQKK